MAIEEYLLTLDDFVGKDVASMNNQYRGQAVLVKQLFDKVSKEVIMPAINGAINSLIDSTAAGSIGVTTPPTLANINAFNGINSICKIYVLDEAVSAYKAATNWSTYANYIYPMSTLPA